MASSTPFSGRATRATRRAAAFKAVVNKVGVKIKDISWTLGDHDGMLIFEAENDDVATAAHLSLGAVGNVHTATCRAFTAPEMDRILTKVHVG